MKLLRIKKKGVQEKFFWQEQCLFKRPKIAVDNTNYKLLQVFDLISNFDPYSQFTLEEAMGKILDYLKDVRLTKEEIKMCLLAYPEKAQLTIYRNDLIYELVPK